MIDIDKILVESIKEEERQRIAKEFREKGTRHECPKCHHITYIIVFNPSD